jgi:hypothetical protein
MIRNGDEFSRVKQLCERGLSDYSIAGLTGIPRATVQRWRQRALPPGAGREPAGDDWRIIDERAYCYLLGMYLGDGHVTHRPPNIWRLHVAADQRYPGISNEVIRSMVATFPGGRPTQRPAYGSASDVLSLSHPAIGRAFPQHGPGTKHQRRIELADWQRELTSTHSAPFIRGLIHSDGCRTVNRVRTRRADGRLVEYAYVRYFFSNQSADIRQLFSEHCGLLGVRVTQSNPRNLSVSHRDSVEILETVAGPKR